MSKSFPYCEQLLQPSTLDGNACEPWQFAFSPLARSRYVHLEHQVCLDRTGVAGSQVWSHFLQQRRQTPHVSQNRGQELVGILNAATEIRGTLRDAGGATVRFEIWQTHILQVAPESRCLVRDCLLERKQQESFPLRVCRGVNLLDFHQYSAAGQKHSCVRYWVRSLCWYEIDIRYRFTLKAEISVRYRMWKYHIGTTLCECICTSWVEPQEQNSRCSACWQRRRWIPPEPEDFAGWSSCSNFGQCWGTFLWQPGIYGKKKKH